VRVVLKPDEPDQRSLRQCRKKSGALDAATLYKLRTWGGVHAPFHDFVWLNHAPSRVQFFGWLLSRGRLQTRAALHRETILSNEETGCPICLSSLETADHLFLGCGFACGFWSAIVQRFSDDARHVRVPWCAPGAVGDIVYLHLAVLLEPVEAQEHGGV
jgi:hypothetical protein